MRSLNARFDSAANAPITSIDQLADNINGINLNREAPPHHNLPEPVSRPSYAPNPVRPSRVSSPSEGAFAREAGRRLMFKEPKPRENLRFAGESKLLRQFLLDIYDGLDQHYMEFASDKRRIIWIAAHFSSVNSDINPAQAWFTSLLMQNAFEHRVTDQYANLKSLDFVIAPLLSADAFIDEMILVFGDKTSAKTAREALDRCKQGSSSIVDYNARFKALAFSVRQHEDDAMIKYVSGLHIDIQEECINIEGWSQVKTLQEKMRLAVIGADRATERAALPQRTQKHKVYQHPNKTLTNTIPVHIPITKPVAIPVPMEIDAITARDSAKRNPFSLIRSICIKKGLCFKCIKPFEASTHMVNGERKCPNTNASLAEKLALLTPIEEKKSDKPIHQIAAIDVEDTVESQDESALNELGEDERATVDWLVEEYLTGLSEPSYPSPADRKEVLDLCSIRLEADHSEPRRFNVPMSLRHNGFSVPVMAFMDTGSGGEFLDDRFARAHGLTLLKKDVPLECVGYDGRKGEVVNHEWLGSVRVVGEDGDWEDHEITLNVTRLGSHEMIIGLPWMKRVGCSMTLAEGKSYLVVGRKLIETLPSTEEASTTLLCKIDFVASDINSSIPKIPDIPSNFKDITSIPKSFISPELSQSSLLQRQETFSAHPTHERASTARGGFSVSQTFPGQTISPELEKICMKYSQIFSLQDAVLPPHRPYDIAIDLKDGCDAPFGGLYNLALNEQMELKEYLNGLLTKGFIRPSKSAAAAPIFFAKVPGKKNRPCVDYRGLNKVSKRDSYPIPVMSWLLNQLKGCTRFAKIDLKAAFNLLRVKEGDEWKTAFRTPWGLFEYLVMPFGLANAPACFQRFIQWVLREYLDIFCFVYLDDILIFSKSDAEHLVHIEKIFSALFDHKLTASAEKCCFFQTSVVFLGFVISTTGISMDPAKLSTIAEWPYPKTLNDLQRFLGFSNFYRRFIPNFSGVAGPMTALTGKKIDTVAGLCTPEVIKSFKTLRNLFSKAPFLIHFDFNLPRILQVDSSGFAFSGILSQKDKTGDLKPVAYFSRKLNDTERRWQVHDQELGAIVNVFEEWRAWLLGANDPILVFSDHANLKYFMTAQNLTARQARWASFLSEFNFDILHIAGKLNPADPASRRADYSDGECTSDKIVLLGRRESLATRPDGVEVSVIKIRNSMIKGCLDPSTLYMPPDSSTITSLKALYDADALLKGRPPSFLRFRDGLWWWRDRLYVPLPLRNFLLKEYHETPAGGHWGSMKFLDMLSRTFGWPNMRTDVLTFVKHCHSCQAVKVDHRPPQGLLKALPIPDRPWSHIGVDFIVKLPTVSTFDSVMVVVDHFSKAAHFIPARESWNAEELAVAFVSFIFKLHGLPDVIFSDRGTTFMSRFWTAVLSHLNILPAPSTAFHPQTDGQVERINALLEDYLRHFVSDEQSDWVSWLPLAEFSYNNTPSASTKFSPFFVQQGFHPRFNSLVASSGIPSADGFVEHLQRVQTTLVETLSAAKLAQAKYYNKDRRVAATYQPGDLVWLSRRNIKTKRPSSKLDVRRLGPFPVRRMVGENAAELELPPGYSRLHPVFNVSLLMPFVSSPSNPSTPNRTPPLDPVQALVNWASARFILDYRQPRSDLHEYLVRDEEVSGLNDEWRLLSTISPNLDPFLRTFHEQSPHLGPGPPADVWSRRLALRV